MIKPQEFNDIILRQAENAGLIAEYGYYDTSEK